ncbi:hypothetical protein [Chitinophaga pinensis]|uniref:Uncharacterized protein n=1 Tax=Chitinophaga pinensis TaxID=79329 RepID=A0A5C6LRL5_9BACT|nr:hypothetical protein [Chitinophaga pinensis]TWV99119.1 hypothetical protein FEF09_17730 [Chitinophaga pinensis]
MATALVFLFQLFITPVVAQISWPQGQLLPSFPSTAQTQDLFILRESSTRWEGEGSSLSHKTGRLESDGWLCQTGIDAADEHMIYGPYDMSIPAGPNVAEFRMKVDNSRRLHEYYLPFTMPTNNQSIELRVYWGVPPIRK